MRRSTDLDADLKRFRETRFPGGCRGKNVYGIELILLDADIYGAAERIAYGHREPELVNLLGSLELSARMALHALDGYAYNYYRQAQELARKALDMIPVEPGIVVRLVEAVIANDEPDADLLAYSGAVLNERAFGHDTALMAAARLGRIAWCRALLAAGADPFLKSEYGWTPFLYAVISGQEAILHLLVEAGVDPTIQGPGGQSALWWAVSFEHEAVVAFLLEQGADPWEKDDEGRDLYSVAKRNRLQAIATRIAEARKRKPATRR